MLGIRLEFSQFGHFDSFSVCRSLTPMDPLNLPSPIATNLSKMYYFDGDVLNVLDRDLYYRVIVHRGLESIVSDEMVTYINSFNAPHNLQAAWNYLAQTLDLTWGFDE